MSFKKNETSCEENWIDLKTHPTRHDIRKRDIAVGFILGCVIGGMVISAGWMLFLL
ncbi:hypothetical protein [Halomonas sp. WWR20]